MIFRIFQLCSVPSMMKTENTVRQHHLIFDARQNSFNKHGSLLIESVVMTFKLDWPG